MPDDDKPEYTDKDGVKRFFPTGDFKEWDGKKGRDFASMTKEEREKCLDKMVAHVMELQTAGKKITTNAPLTAKEFREFVSLIKVTCSTIGTQFQSNDTKLDKIENSLKSLERKLDKLEKKISQIRINKNNAIDKIVLPVNRFTLFDIRDI